MAFFNIIMPSETNVAPKAIYVNWIDLCWDWTFLAPHAKSTFSAYKELILSTFQKVPRLFILIDSSYDWTPVTGALDLIFSSYKYPDIQVNYKGQTSALLNQDIGKMIFQFWLCPFCHKA